MLVGDRLTPRHSVLHQLRMLFEPPLAAPGSCRAVPDPDACVDASWTLVGVHSRLLHAAVDRQAKYTVAVAARSVLGLDIGIISEAWGLQHGCVGLSVNTADVRHHGMGLPRPTWMDRPFDNSTIQQMNFAGLRE